MGEVSGEPIDARRAVDDLLEEAASRRASDIHLEPTPAGYEVRLRVDGMLETVRRHDAEMGRSLVNRLMVMGQLLTYRLDVPQEGRVRVVLPSTGAMELRLAIMPTAQGLRAAVRLPAELVQPKRLEELGLPTSVMEGLLQFARGDSGMLVMTGPAGSGKTTTIYALLQKIVELAPGLSVIALEDPVERTIPGITQIEVSPFGQLTYERALKSILRQDPQVLMLGEIRDKPTASLAMQAALSGHRLICTLHAGSVGGAIARLLEMGIEPYQITSALFGVVNQRLLRRRVEDGYRGRIPVAELAVLDDALRQAVLRRADSTELRGACEARGGFVSMRSVAGDLVRQGTTDAAEVERVLGPCS